MPDTLSTVHGVPVLECAPDGPPLDGESAAVDLLGGVFSARVRTIVVPVSRLGDGFLTLRTRIAGDVVQKFVTYGIRLVIVGDIAAELAASEALRAFVAESNRGRHLWFVDDREALAARLAE